MKKAISHMAVLAAFFLFAAAALQAAPPPQRTVQRRPPSVVRPELNTLQYPSGQSEDFDLFLRKLDTLVSAGSGDVRVLHVGGSHVQFGTWTDRLRRRFLSLRYGIDGGRGLVFPFAAAKTNTPVSYASSYSGNWESVRCLKKPVGCVLGLTGMAITARDTSARVSVDLLSKEIRVMQPRYTFNRVDLLGYGDMEPVLLLNGRDTLEGVRGAEISHFDLPLYTDWIQVTFRPGGESYTLKGIYLDKSNNGFTLSEVGVNGASTRSWLGCEDWEKDLGRVRPDMVILSIGINDIQVEKFDPERFKGNYRRMVKMIHNVNPHCAILFSGINDSWRRQMPNRHTAAAEKAFRELAKEFNAAFWDMFGVMGGEGSMASWQTAGLSRADRIHFTIEGYKLVGDMMFEAIMHRYYTVNPVKQEQ